jgi:putative transposase
MPRRRRVSPDGSVQHVLNRGNRRARIFHQPSDYEDFIHLMTRAVERVPMRVLAFCLMPNHWHMVLWVQEGRALSAYMQWLLTAHVFHHHRVHGTTGTGHLYQDRFRNFIVEGSVHMYRVLRYVEANAMRANLVKRAADWRWSSLNRAYSSDGRQLLSSWPIGVPGNWHEYVNAGIDEMELSTMRHSAQRGSPYGSEEWVAETVAKYGLESTLTPVGRPSRMQDARSDEIQIVPFYGS